MLSDGERPPGAFVETCRGDRAVTHQPCLCRGSRSQGPFGEPERVWPGAPGSSSWFCALWSPLAAPSLPGQSPKSREVGGPIKTLLQDHPCPAGTPRPRTCTPRASHKPHPQCESSTAAASLSLYQEHIPDGSLKGLGSLRSQEPPCQRTPGGPKPPLLSPSPVHFRMPLLGPSPSNTVWFSTERAVGPLRMASCQVGPWWGPAGQPSSLCLLSPGRHRPGTL